MADNKLTDPVVAARVATLILEALERHPEVLDQSDFHLSDGDGPDGAGRRARAGGDGR